MSLPLLLLPPLPSLPFRPDGSTPVSGMVTAPSFDLPVLFPSRRRSNHDRRSQSPLTSLDYRREPVKVGASPCQ
jgi:hypothetical protein